MYIERINNFGFGRKVTTVALYDSVSDFVRIKDEGTCREMWDRSVEKKFKDGGRVGSTWFGTANRGEFDRILANGDKKYVDMVQEKQVTVAPPTSLKRRKTRGDQGDEVCIHAINNGNLATAWTRRTPKPKTVARNIRLCVNICQHCGIIAKESQWVGVAALRTAEAFELAGYRVAIDALFGAMNLTDKENFVAVIPIKLYDEPVDVQSLSSTLCFGGFFRGAGFMNFGLCEGEMSYGLGQPIDDNDMKELVIKLYYKNPSETIELVSKETHSSEKAEKEIARILDKYETGAPQKAAA